MKPSPDCQTFPLRSSIAASVLAVVAVQVLASSGSIDFQPYFFGLTPAFTATIVCSIGVAALAFLQRRFGMCAIAARFSASGIVVAAVITVPFIVSVTLADVLLGFPSDINVGLPAALAFYPAMGLVAQLALHIVPFAIALSFLGWSLRNRSLERCVWIAMVLSASVEAAFQLIGTATGSGPKMLTVFVGVQLFAFGVAELYLYRRFDFVTMYVFRLIYYGYWHILWGNLLRSAW